MRMNKERHTRRDQNLHCVTSRHVASLAAPILNVYREYLVSSQILTKVGIVHTEYNSIPRVRTYALCYSFVNRFPLRYSHSPNGCDAGVASRRRMYVHRGAEVAPARERDKKSVVFGFACIPLWGKRPIVRGSVSRLRWRSVKSTTHRCSSTLLYDGNATARLTNQQYLLLSSLICASQYLYALTGE